MVYELCKRNKFWTAPTPAQAGFRKAAGAVQYSPKEIMDKVVAREEFYLQGTANGRNYANLADRFGVCG